MWDLGILARHLDVHDLVFWVLKIELLSVSEVRREALKWLPDLFMNEIHHPSRQGLQGDYLECGTTDHLALSAIQVQLAHHLLA